MKAPFSRSKLRGAGPRQRPRPRRGGAVRDRKERGGVVLRVHEDAERELPRVAGAVDLPSSGACLREDREEESGQDRHNGNDDEQLDQRKSWLTASQSATSEE